MMYSTSLIIIGTLKWKDDQGGNINEFMSQVQLTTPTVVGSQDSKKETITQLKPDSVRYHFRVFAVTLFRLELELQHSLPIPAKK